MAIKLEKFNLKNRGNTKESRPKTQKKETTEKKQKGTGKSPSSSKGQSKIEKLVRNSIGKQTGGNQKKSFAQQFKETTQKQFKTTMKEAAKKNRGKSLAEIEYHRGSSLRTEEEKQRKQTLFELDRYTAKEERKNRKPFASTLKDRMESASTLKDSEKAGVGMGTIRHGTLNKNADFYLQNWNKLDDKYKADATIQIIYSYGVNEKNNDLIMSEFERSSTYNKQKILDAVIQTDGYSDVALEMKRAIKSAPDAEQALMQRISEDMDVRNGNYIDTFKQAAAKAIIDQNTIQQKRDKVIADWAKENYDTKEAILTQTYVSGSSFGPAINKSIGMGLSYLLDEGQKDNVLEGIDPTRGVAEQKTVGDKLAKVGTNVLHDLFRIAGMPVSLLSKAFLSEQDVDKISKTLLSVNDDYYETVRNNIVAAENSNLTPAQKEAITTYGMVLEQIPNIVISVVTGVPAAGLVAAGLSAGGKYAQSAYQQGATLEESVRFGLVGAAGEVATEKLFTGFGYFGKGLSSKLLTDTTRKMLENSAFKDSVSANILKRVVAGGGEATEEMIMEVVTPYLERSTYDPNADGATLDEVLHSGGLGFVVAQILGLPANALGVTDAALRQRDIKTNERMVNRQIGNIVTDALESGEITQDEADNIRAQVKDFQKGKGSLMESEQRAEEKTIGENLDKVYADFNEAREAMQAEAKTKGDGETVTARFIQDGQAKLWRTKVKDGRITAVFNGTTTASENAKYTAKAQKIATAANAAERTGYQLNVKDEIVKEVSALSNAFGKEVEFIHDERTAVHGYEEGGKIFVNVNSTQSPAAAVVAHEMTHLLETTSSYKKLQDMAFRFYGSSLEDKRADIADIYKGVKELYNDDGTINTAFVDTEVMAAFVEEKLLNDAESIKQVVKEDRTLAEKIVDWINKVIQKITGTKEQRFLINARDMWAKALQEEQINKKAPMDGAEQRFSFGGENAKMADKGALETAKGMRAEGKDPEEIFRETGWFVGADGKWRFEISNDDLELKIVGFKTREDTMVDLGDVIESEKLFSAYPDLAWMTVEFKDIEDGYAGMYDPHFDSIEISYDTFFNDREIFKDVLVHEIQHAIQRRESFARGASEEYWKKKIANGFDSRRKEDIEEEEQLQKEYDKYRENNYELFRDVTELNASTPQVPRGKINWETLEQIEEDPVEWQKYDARRDELEEKYGDAVFEFSRIISRLNAVRKRERTPKELYRSTAGEIEANNTAERRNLTEGQRRDRFPMNRFEYRDVVFADRSGRSGLLVGYTKDGRSVYTSSFPESMTEEEKVDEFKNKIETIFNLGAVELKTNVKKIKVLGDKFTQQKNTFGDLFSNDEERSAKYNLLYDYADILENSEFVMASPEESFINPSVLPKNKAHKDVKYWYKFKNNIVLDGVGYRVMFNIRDKGKDQYAYLIELKKDGTSDLSNTVYKNLLRSDQMSHSNIISDSSEKSKQTFSIGRSEDSAYLDAVNRGDMETAQRMVDEAAKAAGYDIRAYHGTGYDFTVFDKSTWGKNYKDWGSLGKGFYFTPKEKDAKMWADKSSGDDAKVLPVYLKGENLLDVYDSLPDNLKNTIPKEWDDFTKRLAEKYTANYIEYMQENGQDIQSILEINGFDGLKAKGSEYVVFDPNQIKSADPVTYDDEGNVIPLSERFKSENDDIRYSIGRSELKVNAEMRDLIKAHNAAMREVFYNRKRADHKELWDLIKDEMAHIIQTGAERRRVVDDIVRLAYDTGYINNAVEEQETGENTWGRGIHVPEEYRGEMNSLGGLRAINSQLAGSGLFLTFNRNKKGTNEKYGGIDDAYSWLLASNPMLPDTIDPAEQVEALIELFGKTDGRRTLEELDEEAVAMGEDAPYLSDIRNAVETAMSDIATMARYNMSEAARQSGIETGLKRGKKQGAADQRKEQRKLDEATMREFDKLNKQRAEDERKDAEATMRMHDRLIKEVYNEAKSLSAEEKRDIRRAVREKGEEKMKKELAKRAAQYRKERSNARKNLNAVMKEAEKQAKNYERKLSAPEKEAMRKKQERTDRDRRAERLHTAKEEYKRNAPKPAEGSAKAMYLENNKAQKLVNRFRVEAITRLVNMGAFVETNGEVVLDENGMEIAYHLQDTEQWDVSIHKNTYTPSWGLTLLAEKEGIDKDVFFTIFSKIADMRTKRNKNGTLVYKKQDVVDYIISLSLTSKQKDFLYFDVAKYAFATKPLFLPGGRVKESAGNKRGRMLEALDNIGLDMFKGVMDPVDIFDTEHSDQIRQKDILAFLDAVFGKEDSAEKAQYAEYFVGLVVDYTAHMETIRMLDRTNLLTDKPKEKNSPKMQILRAYRESKRLFVAEGEAFERMSEKLKNPLITARYYAAKKSSAIANEMIYGKTQRDLQGKKHGKSLYEIFKPVFRADEKAGNNNNMKELTELVNCRHDIYRLRNGKGYTGYSIEECERIVERISREHPELLKVADEIAEYGRVLLRMCVESGRISEADYQYFTAKYPYYAPTFRLRSNEYIDRKGNVIRRDTKVIRTAKGGNDDVLPLFDQFVRRTQEIVKACKKNQLATELARAYTLPNSAEYIRDVREAEKQEDKEKEIANLGEVEDIGRARKEDGAENVIPWYSNGKKYDIEVEDEALIFGWDRITYRRNEYAIATAFRKMNNIRRGVLTQYNPTFWLTNGIKDIQDMYLYNQHAQRLPKFHLEAAKTMFAGTFGKGKDEEALEEYLSFGMSQASIFEYDNTNSGRRTKRARVNEAMRKPIDAFNALNFMVEQTPRLAVYNETVDRLTKQKGKKGGNTYTDEEIKTIASYQASDATLNFGRSGTVIKEMNTYGFTFLNAGVQGMDRFRRMFMQVKDGNKRAILINICGLIVKLGIVGISWNVLTDWIYGGDDEYAEAIREALYGEDADKLVKEYSEMADYQKTNYLLLNVNGVWIRIPKGRLASFIYGFVYNGEKVYSGEMDALDLITAQMDLASETILFSNPITNNILGPFVDVWRNKDAWDNAIVSEYEDMGEGFHYLEHDEETTDLAIKIAEFGHYLTGTLFEEEGSRILDISPKKLDYLIEQYLGSYANMIMPFLSKEQNLKDNALGALETMIKKFYIDPTSSNRLAGDYYDLKEEFENVANAHEGDSPYAVAAKVFADYTDDLKVLREEINAIGADSSLNRKEKLEQISGLREQMNELYRQGIIDAKEALAFARENYYGSEENSDTYEEWEKLTKGAEWQISNMSDSAQAQWQVVQESGVDAGSFVKACNFIKDATADKDENGKSINGSKKQKVVKYLNGLDLSAEQKLVLYYELGGYSRNGEIPAFGNGAVGGSGLSANMASPVAGGGRISSGYGPRNTGIPGASTYHQAVDIAAPAGTDVGASMTGTVTRVSSSGGYGNSVEITSTDADGNTIVTKYSHLLNFGVEVGDVVGQGTKIGEVGSTGTSSGNHLDFKLGINGEWVDPLQYVDLAAAGIVDARGYSQKTGTGGTTAISGGSRRTGYSSGGGSGRTSSVANVQRTETKYDTIGKITSDGRIMLPTAKELANVTPKAITGRSTKAPNYGSGGVFLPTAREYNEIRKRAISSSVATTKRTDRTGGSLWDDNILG